MRARAELRTPLRQRLIIRSAKFQLRRPIQNLNNMAPIIAIHDSNMEEAPMSRTHQYRKVMKPLLERKRRARINKCLDDLKDLMVFAMQSEGESITKLEKADVLELTVRHLQKLKRQQQLQANPNVDMDRYRAGYTACISEVSRFLTATVPATVPIGHTLMNHLTTRLHHETALASSNSPVSPASHTSVRPQLSVSPSSVSDVSGYNSGRDSSSPVSVGAPSPKPQPASMPVWRPF